MLKKRKLSRAALETKSFREIDEVFKMTFIEGRIEEFGKFRESLGDVYPKRVLEILQNLLEPRQPIDRCNREIENFFERFIETIEVVVPEGFDIKTIAITRKQAIPFDQKVSDAIAYELWGLCLGKEQEEEKVECFLGFLLSRKVVLEDLRIRHLREYFLKRMNPKIRKLLLLARESPESLFHKDCFPLDLLKIIVGFFPLF